MNGLAPHTGEIFEAISKLECIKPYVLVGGSALSLQIGTRQSEDLDFMKWCTNKNEKPEVAWYQIEKELATIGKIENKNLLDINHIEYLVAGVKLSFYACDKYSPVTKPIKFLNNLKIADITAIGAMKMEVMLRRSNFRDYYDIYSILKEGVSINTLITLTLQYSGHKLKSKNLLAMLTNSHRFKQDYHFEQLKPTYTISPQEIEDYIKSCLIPKKKRLCHNHFNYDTASTNKILHAPFYINIRPLRLFCGGCRCYPICR